MQLYHIIPNTMVKALPGYVGKEAPSVGLAELEARMCFCGKDTSNRCDKAIRHNSFSLHDMGLK